MIASVMACLCLAACDEDGARAALEDQGYKQIKLTGPGFFGCSKDDGIVNTFEASAPGGHRIKGVVCSGIFVRGYTIRTLGRLP